jgi:DNA polymerase-3 subunit delta
VARRATKAAGITMPVLRKAIAGGEIAPAYFLLGEEPALRRRALECIRSAFNEDDGMPGTVVQLDGARATVSEIVDEARSLPLFSLMVEGPARLVWVRDADRLAASDVAELAAYFEAPVAATCIVFEAGKVDKRKVIFKTIAKAAVLVDCEPPKRESDVAIWIEATLRNRGYAIEPDAVAYLLQMAGTRITVLEQELEKVMLYVGDSGTVHTTDLEGIMGRTREHSIFELTDALVRADHVAALHLLNILLDDGESPIGVLAMVGWICRQLVVASDLTASGCSRKEAMEGIAGRWQQRGEILDRARRAERSALVQTLVGCAETDIFIKRMRDARPGVDRLRPARGRLEALCRQICAA